jgi:hypothetical protein
MENAFYYFRRFMRLFFTFLFLLLTVHGSNLPAADQTENIRKFTRQIEFDYLTWTLDAVVVKTGNSSIDPADLMSVTQQHHFVESYVLFVRNLRMVNNEIVTIFSDPAVKDPETIAGSQILQRDELLRQMVTIGPVAEGILQRQISSALNELHLAKLGKPFPPVLYHSTPLPYALIVSPRDVVRQDANISIVPGLTIEQIIQLEDDVTKNLNVSALVEEVGGIGTYPTMVQETDDLNWLIEVISHEWIHNYLTLSPLGINYDTSPELRTMNETTASLAGKEIASAVIARYYPEREPPPPPPVAETPQLETQSAEPPSPPEFDFREEMHTTRLKVDDLLAAGKIDEAETYMEQRRQFLWEHGYQIRKLNQAYFAFHGAYADVPGGAAGSDPVGPAVRAFREKSASLSDFIINIARLSSFEELQQALIN